MAAPYHTQAMSQNVVNSWPTILLTSWEVFLARWLGWFTSQPMTFNEHPSIHEHLDDRPQKQASSSKIIILSYGNYETILMLITSLHHATVLMNNSCIRIINV